MGAEYFNGAAKSAIRWTAGQLTEEEREFLGGLPEVTEVQDFTLVHGSLRAPVEEYLLGPEAAEATLRRMKSRFCLIGHSHIPFLCRESSGPPQFFEFTEGKAFPLGRDRMIVNPGCVGQPRDRDPRPSYAIYDSKEDTVERHRVHYSYSGYATEDARCQAAGVSDRAIWSKRRVDFLPRRSIERRLQSRRSWGF